MQSKRALALILFGLGVSLLDTCLPSIANAAEMPPTTEMPTTSNKTTAQPALPKSYAVFLATYDPATGQAVGGVAGSAFFTSPTQAITAFHVLQSKSFTTNARTQVWLVHEGEPAIELEAADLASDSNLDRTTITLHGTRARLVYEVANTNSESLPVETDGFRANSAGPELAPSKDGKLTITRTEKLERLHAEGFLLQRQAVDLTSLDVNLKHAPCVQLSYKPIVGLSGGPVTSNGRVIAMNSFADPSARANTWAVSINRAQK